MKRKINFKNFLRVFNAVCEYRLILAISLTVFEIFQEKQKKVLKIF